MSDSATWDDLAEHFDEAADHGLRDAVTRRAWDALLTPLLPREASRIADLGCGTGSLSMLFAAHGHEVTGVDFSARMIELAREKAEAMGLHGTFVQGDASQPPLPDASFDAVVSRHVLWAMPDPTAALSRWAALLRPGGRVILIEGRWHTGAGLTAAQTHAIVDAVGMVDVSCRALPDPELWGGEITDERYLVTARVA